MEAAALQTKPGRFTVEDFRLRLEARGDAMADPVGVEYGDHLLNPDIVQLMERAKVREAAVLVPLVDPPDAKAEKAFRTDRLSRRIDRPGGCFGGGGGPARGA